MKLSIKKTLYLGATLLYFATINGWSGLANAAVVVIVNPSNSATIDDEQIAKIFLGQTKTFSNSSEAIPIDQKEGALREEFGNKLLKKSQSQLKAVWARQIFTGGAKPPKELGGDDEILKFVASTPGAIAYIDSSKLNKTVKALK